MTLLVSLSAFSVRSASAIRALRNLDLFRRQPVQPIDQFIYLALPCRRVGGGVGAFGGKDFVHQLDDGFLLRSNGIRNRNLKEIFSESLQVSIL